ncbi:hypothetical protein Fmac_015347 [Flemingia macrophylla]|uniref:Uncharacterized protein n=1 Tax=Flemingia macrophylla TaxID=520843 RepID=A0ABD1MEC3_9FABA
MLQIPIADHHSSRHNTLDREDGSQLLVVPSNTSAETRKLEGKLDALVNLVTQLAANKNPTSVARVCGIRSSNDQHTSVCPSSQQSGVDEHPKAYAPNTYSRPPQQGVHDMATDTSAETRKLEGKLNALVNLVTQLVANQKSASVARVYDIRSSNDHHTSVCPSLQQYGQFSAGNDSIVIRGVHGVATDTSAETRKLEGKLDALVNLVTQLAANQKPASVARFSGYVLPTTTILVSVLLRSNLEWMSILTLMLQTPIANHHSIIDKALDREDGSQLLALQIRSLPLLEEFAASVLPMTTILVPVLLRRNLEWMSILRLILQTPIAVHHSNRDKALDREDGSQLLESSARNDSIIIKEVHDVAIETSTETRKLESKLDALVNLVTQQAGNQKPTSVPRVCGIRSSNDHHTSVCASSQQYGVDEHPEAYAVNTYSRPPQHQRQGT